MHLLVQVLGRLGREELRAELRDACVMDAGLELRVRVGADGRPLLALARLSTGNRDRRLASGLAARLAVLSLDAVVESHSSFSLCLRHRAAAPALFLAL